MKYRARLIAVVSAIIGTALFVYVLAQTGASEIWHNITNLGAGLLIILLISSIRYLARSYAWLRCTSVGERAGERAVGFSALLRARIAGEAIGDLTFGPVVAEPMRIVALGNRLSVSSGVSSLAVEHISYAMTSSLMVAAGSILLLAGIGLSGSLRTAMILSLLLVLSVIVVFVLLICRRVKLGSMLLGRLLNKNLKNAFSGKLAYLSQLEEYVFDFFSTRPKDFFLLIASHAVFHLAGILEIYATLKLIGFDISLTNAFILESVNRTINIMFTFVPALIGVDEAGSGLVAASLGIGATAGVSLAIIRKIRMFFWIALGLVFLYTRNDSKSKS